MDMGANCLPFDSNDFASTRRIGLPVAEDLETRLRPRPAVTFSQGTATVMGPVGAPPARCSADRLK